MSSNIVLMLITLFFTFLVILTMVICKSWYVYGNILHKILSILTISVVTILSLLVITCFLCASTVQGG